MKEYEHARMHAEIKAKIDDLGCTMTVVFLVYYLFPAFFMTGTLMENGYGFWSAVGKALVWPVFLGPMLADCVLGG